MNHWIYALPGTHLQGLRSAGAPSLERLATQRRDMDTQNPEDWRGWILYGSPDQALRELCSSRDERNNNEAIQRWSQQMVLASQAKRDWRDRLMLIHLDPGASNSARSTALKQLQQALPELELQARLKRYSQPQSIADDLASLAALCLMQSDPSVLQAYLDLESWADQPSQQQRSGFWRSSPSHNLIMNALSQASRLESLANQSESLIAKLQADIRRSQVERKQLHHNLEQLESELEHYVAEHLSLNDITARLEEQLLRARRLIST